MPFLCISLVPLSHAWPNIINNINSNLHISLYILPDVDDCDPTPCENGATCVDDHDGYTCQCTEQWFGDNCTGILT